MDYSVLKDTAFLPAPVRERTIANLAALREQLSEALPAKDAEDHMLLGTWNIRDFGKAENLRKGRGPRLPETHFYIAEVTKTHSRDKTQPTPVSQNGSRSHTIVPWAASPRSWRSSSPGWRCSSSGSSATY